MHVFREASSNNVLTAVVSAQVTVFNCPPPSIPCMCGPCPLLKLFHEMSVAEQDKFITDADEILPGCTFCDPLYNNLYLHFFGDKYDDPEPYIYIANISYRIRFECTWPGCKKSYASFTHLLNHYSYAHDQSLSRELCSFSKQCLSDVQV